MTRFSIQSAIECIRSSLKLIAEGRNEEVVRHNFTSYLRAIFPDLPGWVERLIAGTESYIKIEDGSKTHRGFVDNLVDLSYIEFESNLTIQAKFNEGFQQIKRYCLSALNDGCNPELIIGVLSDTVRWRAYRIRSIKPLASNKADPEYIDLEEIDSVDLSAADEVAARKLVNFLNKYIGRVGSRPLNARSIASDLGFESKFCKKHIEALKSLVAEAFKIRPKYARLIADLWCRFVRYLREQTATGHFEQEEYADELYILTLAKLVCANVIERKALTSDDTELRTILQGDFFKARGLLNLVEYDYFGWLTQDSFLNQLLPVARAIQDDLRAYDFSRSPAEDLFGQMMAQLATRTQRLLLGQEWTPNWLARLITKHVLSKLPDGESPRFVDMCCGSGTFIVETVKLVKEEIGDETPQEKKLQFLLQAITGFDIDPLAVMLAKVNWVVAARDWLEPFGAFSITIPVYHADSLFAITPLSEVVNDEHDLDFYELQIADARIKLPCFLVSPEFQLAFDEILNIGYRLAVTDDESPVILDESTLDEAISKALTRSSAVVNHEQKEDAKQFLRNFTFKVNELHREGYNGIWAFILRNSYRPGLVAGQFNGLVSNPPWLALSKIAENPYRDVLRKKAEQFGIKPPGPSFLHIEMATIFLLHAVDRYLKPDAVIGCITPETVLNGYHHDPFRTARFATAKRPVNFTVDEIWRVQENTFKNKAIVIFGRKAPQQDGQLDSIPGHLALESGLLPLTFYRHTQGRRTAWSEQEPDPRARGFFFPAHFREGADIMPRTLFFHEVTPAPETYGTSQWSVRPIQIGASRFSFVIKDVHEFKDFRLSPCILPDDLFFDVLISKLLTPFDLVAPLKALLPIRKGVDGKWEPLSQTALAVKGAAALSAFQQICATLGTSADLNIIWDRINERNKLAQQVIEPGGYLVFTGASGKNVCAAFAGTDQYNLEKLIIDQTLYWARVQTLEEAIYLTGLFNSEAVNKVIREFQPEGAFGERHIHSLAFSVTPPFDSSQAAHQDVVEQTRRLLADYASAKATDPQLADMLDPNKGTLQRRRKVIREKLKQLPSYNDYALACRSLYGV